MISLKKLLYYKYLDIKDQIIGLLGKLLGQCMLKKCIETFEYVFGWEIIILRILMYVIIVIIFYSFIVFPIIVLSYIFNVNIILRLYNNYLFLKNDYRVNPENYKFSKWAEVLRSMIREEFAKNGEKNSTFAFIDNINNPLFRVISFLINCITVMSNVTINIIVEFFMYFGYFENDPAEARFHVKMWFYLIYLIAGYYIIMNNYPIIYMYYKWW